MPDSSLLQPAASHAELPARSLRWYADTTGFTFSSTASVHPLEGVIGQHRALEALTLGAEITSPGYNIFVSGLAGTGRLTTIKNILDRMHPDLRITRDYAYVMNFKNEDNPRLLTFTKGKGIRFCHDIKEAIDYLRTQLPRMFEEDKLRTDRRKIVEEYQGRERAILEEFEARIKPMGFVLGHRKTDADIVQPEVVPIIDGKPHSIADMEELVKDGTMTIEQAREIGEKYNGLQQDLYALSKQGMRLSQEYQKAIAEFERNAAQRTVDAALDELRTEYNNSDVHEYLDEVCDDILQDLDLFKRIAPDDSGESGVEMMNDPFSRYSVNLILDNSGTVGVPVIIETTPTFINLFGTVERVQDQSGTWSSDFLTIKPGSLLRADGGFLIINALDALSEPGVWKGLKRVLLHRKLEIQPIESFFQSTSQAVAIKPEAIKLDVKVILIGDSRIYQALYQAEEDFRKIFKINAQFDHEIKRTEGLLVQYTHFISRLCNEEHLLHFDPEGVAAVLESAVEHSGSNQKISLRFSDIADLLREASYWAEKYSAEMVSRYHVEKATKAMIDRNSALREKIVENIETGTIMIDTDGRKVGQINGLAVYDIGQIAFGIPVRVTVTVSVGWQGIVNIEREANLSGSIYDKGALILNGFFQNRFAQKRPLAFSSSIVFEQSYGGIDGDSASSTEVYGLLSAFSRIPIRQDLAVTGSVNQWGEVQPIGGVKEKIEGFYDVCARRGLTGTQGVLIPVQNIPDLMLRLDVVKSVADGMFHVYPVSTIDQGIEILTGVAAGMKDVDGNYPQHTINFFVEERLAELAESLKYNMPPIIGGTTRVVQAPQEIGNGETSSDVE